MITLETMGIGGLMARQLNVIAETDFFWSGGQSGGDVFLREAIDAETHHVASAPQIVFRCDGSHLDLQVDQPRTPTVFADQLVTAIMLNMATRNGRTAHLRARAILAIGDCEDDTVPLDGIEPHVAISKGALGWLHRELREGGRSNEVRLQAGAPFRLRGLFGEPKLEDGRSDWRPAPSHMDAHDASIGMGIVVVSSRASPLLCMTAVGVSTAANGGPEMAGLRHICGCLGGDV